MELADADRILRARKTNELMLSGVTIERPETVIIDTQVRVGMDTVIEASRGSPATQLSGRIVTWGMERFSILRTG